MNSNEYKKIEQNINNELKRIELYGKSFMSEINLKELNDSLRREMNLYIITDKFNSIYVH